MRYLTLFLTTVNLGSKNKILFFSRFSETGEALVSSVDKVIFVGSPGVGKMVCLLLESSGHHISLKGCSSSTKENALHSFVAIHGFNLFLF